MFDSATRRDTILVVDDTPETLGLLTDTLDHAGYTVLIATDGAGALELVDQVTPDIVLMDAVMPGLTGFETCRRLKRDKLLTSLPVIFMTGLSDTEHVVEGLAAGGVDYVTKPIVVDELLARIRVHLANARMAFETHAELDATGRFLLAIDQTGKLLWCTPKARHLIDEQFPVQLGTAPTLPHHITSLLLQPQPNNSISDAPTYIEINQRKLQFTLLSSIGPDELLFRIAESQSGNDEQRLQKNLGLTSREAEILAWISRGKTNRDVGEILSISPRTVNKHLEQVFTKLGVENRAAATARAIKALAR